MWVTQTSKIIKPNHIMADGYLEKRQQDYETRKAEYLRKKKHLPLIKKKLQQPDDEAL